jgi:hypothetical protein
MLHYAETHGIEVLITYYILISVLGTLPPLPENATYLEKWGFAVANAICGNARSVMASLNQQTTSISSTTSTTSSITTEKPKE